MLWRTTPEVADADSLRDVPDVHVLAVLLGVVVCGLLGIGVPALVARVPEPPADTTPEADGVPVPGPALDPGPERDPEHDPASPLTDPESPKEPPKELYADMAALPGLPAKCAVVAAVAGGLAGWAIGWDWRLLPWLAFTPVGVALGLIDWRTKLLPTRIVAPSYGLVGALTLLAVLLGQDLHALRGAALGWLVWGVLFGLLWLIQPRGMGYGDVRLSGVLGILLGALGWPQLLCGIYATFLIGPIGGLVLMLLRLTEKRRFPFGPFMLVGALVGALVGPAVLHGLGL